MRDCRLFVSHTCRVPEDGEDFADAAARAAETSRRERRLAGVCAGLHDAGFRVLVDRGYEMDGHETFADHIHAGDDWSLRLDEWLAECHAAIILFNRAALDASYWVSKEAAILSWRRRLDPAFTLVPVLLDDVTPDDLRQGLHGVLRIADAQCVRSAGDAAAIVQALKDTLGDPARLVTTTPFDRLERALARNLAGAVDEETLAEAWEALERPGGVSWVPGARAPFARALARLLVRDGGVALRNLEHVLQHLDPPLPPERARQVLSRVQGLWVDSAAAGALPGAAEQHVAAGLEARRFAQFTARCYLQRAWPAAPHARPVPTTAMDASRTAEDLRREIREALYPEADPVGEAASIDADIRGRSDRIVVVIPPGPPEAPVPDDGLVEELLDAYPNLLFLVGTCNADPATLPASIVALEPPLDPQVEQQRWLEYNRVLSLIP